MKKCGGGGGGGGGEWSMGAALESDALHHFVTSDIKGHTRAHTEN